MKGRSARAGCAMLGSSQGVNVHGRGRSEAEKSECGQRRWTTFAMSRRSSATPIICADRMDSNVCSSVCLEYRQVVPVTMPLTALRMSIAYRQVEITMEGAETSVITVVNCNGLKSMCLPGSMLPVLFVAPCCSLNQRLAGTTVARASRSLPMLRVLHALDTWARPSRNCVDIAWTDVWSYVEQRLDCAVAGRQGAPGASNPPLQYFLSACHVRAKSSAHR
ncbi:uncharacterized protein M421DRAFT_328080 [Didymella exigua CBS 183.55]|uniref:Uncharacterized protein n=1 Tax=Didymella exigua CBS 183.55 TaxID=1150837 RepID=A0A6A5R7I3_9PLEO|nr:uncharacterized protein M421DRAFT_328080 [Didymella exigua CBS 183.55]KAF1923299.1 hypothetical protein M421DRAFT_328080 [Didymella exigua CBS 183.55]